MALIDAGRVRAALRDAGLAAWLLYDFRGSNPVFWHALGSEPRATTRRLFCVVPADGEPVLIASPLDRNVVAGLGLPLRLCGSWPAVVDALREHLPPRGRVAMEYSPGGALPIASWVDAGTVELVRSFGVEVVSSGDLFQIVAGVWDAQALASHREAVGHVLEVRDLALERARGSTERAVSAFVAEQFARRGLEAEDQAVVAVGPHAGDPHHEPEDAPVGDDEVLLLDLWARRPGERNVYADVTWMAWTGPGPLPERVQEVFAAVAAGRDAALALLRRGGTLRGFEVDRACRAEIAARGLGDAFIHRTGHSLGPGPRVHGLGANLDDLETHDDRTLVPGTGFTVEPGVYLPEFGVRLEVDVFWDPRVGPEVTTPVQAAIERLE
ncbi:MAG TPA: M24 family metallopeptidase [Solirubrobacteraceae bacterium]|nr:M24 family metallopeptidase [Solirubrobacteraceae bacterium]